MTRNSLVGEIVDRYYKQHPSQHDLYLWPFVQAAVRGGWWHGVIWGFLWGVLATSSIIGGIAWVFLPW